MIKGPCFNTFKSKEDLVKSIRECAQDLIDNAEEYIGSIDNLENVEVTMYFARDSFPRIDVATNYSMVR